MQSAQRRAAQVEAASLDRGEHGVKDGGHADDLGDPVGEQLGGADGMEALHRAHAPAGEQRSGAGDGEAEQMREGQQREHVVARRRMRRRLDGGARVGEQVRVREHGAERRAGHRRRVDDDRFLVAAADVALAGEGQAVMRAEVDVLRAVGGDDARGARRVVEQHDGDTGGHARGERARS